jgi:hypothetical protein
MKRVLHISILLPIAFAVVIAGVFGPYTLHVQHFDARPANGYSAGFILTSGFFKKVFNGE